jgi:oligopeptide transport system permease protein
MSGLILRRLLQAPLILLVIYTITFTLAWLIPGNPLENPEGRRPPPEVAEAMKARYNLDSYWGFYWDYLANATSLRYVQGREGAKPFDLGPSLRHQDWTVNEILADQLPVSLTLGMLAIFIACGIGILAGMIGGTKPGSLRDFATLIVALVGISLPSFVIGTVLLVTCSVWWKIFPIASWGTLGDMILPALTLSLPFAAYIARLTRFGMIDQMNADYVRAARARGVGELRIVIKHALKNAALPVLSYLGPAAAMAMTGSFVVERVFAVPGIGQHFVDAVLSKDLTLIMGVVIVYSTLLVCFNLLVDVLYHWIDPRITLAGSPTT